MTRAPSSASRSLAAEASTWFVEFREGNVAPARRARFDEWLRRSPEHIQAYLEVSAAWSELPTSDPESRIDVEALITRARASCDDNIVALGASGLGEDTPGGLEGRSRARWNPFSIFSRRLPPAIAVSSRSSMSRRLLAASVAFLAMLVCLGVWLTLFRVDTYTTGLGEQRTVRLADGSTLELNALSKVRIRLSSASRDIELASGQALFHVTKDPARPFIVRSGEATVRAVGTQFDVYRKMSGTTVTVLEGEVAVLSEGRGFYASPAPSAPPERMRQGGAPAGATRPVLLSAGEQVTVTAQQVSKPKKADVAAATGWTEHRLVFEATPLAEVADEFNRYNAKRLVIADGPLRSLGISGVYSSADPESLIGFLRAQPVFVLTETADEIHVALREGAELARTGQGEPAGSSSAPGR
jgi:transmembrane sensor